MAPILYQGLLRSPASWARVGRGYLKAFSALGIEVAAVSSRGFRYDRRFPLPQGVYELTPDEARAAPEPAVGLGFLHPPLVNRLIGKLRVNLFVWESNRVPSCWVEAFRDQVDLVVVPSTFTQDALVASGLAEAKVSVVPYGFDDDAVTDAANHSAPPTASPFTFLAVLSPHRRKGIRELFAAYRQAFTARDDVLLRVKTTYDPSSARRRFPFEISSWQTALREARLLEENAPPVLFDFRTLDDGAIVGLFRRAHVYVNPSWGEAFGLALLEAMASGLPAIATGWGGHLGFFPESEDRLPYRLIEAGDALYTPVVQGEAAIPDIEALAGRMRWHRQHPQESRRIGLQLQQKVANLTWIAAARRLLAVLERFSDK